jgi:hypothetical protein
MKTKLLLTAFNVILYFFSQILLILSLQQQEQATPLKNTTLQQN